VSEAKVGIGTSSPDQKLQVDGNIRLGDTATGVDDDEDYGLRTGGSLTLHANDSGNNTFNTALAFDVGNASGAQAASSKIQFKVNNTERMRIDSSGNVGIGTDSPTDKLHVSTGTDTDSGNIAFTIGGSSATNARTASITKNTSSPYELTIQAGNHATSNMETIFKSSDSRETMRIDSSGNVLVGTTTQFGTDAISLNQSGWFYVRRTSDKAATFRLDGDDGNIITFDKAGSTVGSIGTETGRLTIGSGDTGLRFLGDTDEITPWNTSTNAGRDALIDLGNTNNRFKDLYLSGGVHLGGTGSANKLDDYEEGTWTPTIVGSTSGTASLNVSQATYTKIGNTVRVACFITGANVTGLSGAVRLAGLPFSVFTYTPVTVTYCNLFSFDEADGIGGFTEAGQTYVNLVFGSSKSLIQHTSADATNGTVMFTAVYNTSA
jgi:hypothetical protein